MKMVAYFRKVVAFLKFPAEKLCNYSAPLKKKEIIVIDIIISLCKSFILPKKMIIMKISFQIRWVLSSYKTLQNGGKPLLYAQIV